MDYFSVKNFEKFQHYKKRNPPWIKFHRAIFENYDFECLPDLSKLHLVFIWLLASQLNNKVPNDSDWIKKKVGLKGKINLDILFKKGFLIKLQAAGKTLAKSKQSADTETETETETEAKVESEKPLSPGKEFTETYQAEQFWLENYREIIKEEPLLSIVKDRKILKILIKKFGLEEVKKRMLIHLENRKLLSIGGFQTCFNDLVVIPKKPFETHEEKQERERRELREKYA